MQVLKEKVKALRRKKGWSQEDLARAIDVNISTVQRWESRGARLTRHARSQLQRLFKDAEVDDD